VNKLNRSEKMLAERTVCVLLVRGESPEDEPVFAYVAVRADRLDEFVEAQKKEPFYPDEYGIIVESGVGEPCEEVRDRMERDYGFDHGAMMDIHDTESANEVARKLTKAASDQKKAQFDA
jgi:hypothetical protein